MDEEPVLGCTQQRDIQPEEWMNLQLLRTFLGEKKRRKKVFCMKCRQPFVHLFSESSENQPSLLWFKSHPHIDHAISAYPGRADKSYSPKQLYREDLAFFILRIDFHHIYGFTTWLSLFPLVSFWCEITHGQCTNILNGPKLCHNLDLTVPAYAAKWSTRADALLPRNRTDGSVSSGILQ